MISKSDVRRLLGDLDDEKVAEILKLAPVFADLEAAAMALDGSADVPAQRGHALSGKAAAIMEIAQQDPEDDGRRSAR
jgi:hypothetical protein